MLKMIGGRVLARSIRCSGLSWRTLASQKPWTAPLSSSARALSSIKKVSLGASVPSTPSPFTDMTLISKRFFQNGNSNSSGTSNWSSKLFAAACGVLLGAGTGAAYQFMGDNDSILGKYYTVACAEKDNCGCEQPPPTKVENCEEKEKKCVVKKCEDSVCLRALECEEELIIRANRDLEKALKDTKGKAVEYTESAMKAYCEAITLMCDYMNNGYTIIDDDDLEPPDYEEAWCCMYKVAKKRCEKVKDAIQKGQCAWELLCRLREVIENGKACKYTSCNPLLVTAEDSLNCAEKELLELKARMDCARSDHEMVAKYKSVVENFRADLKSDVSKQIAELECDIQFVEQEVAMQIIQAYKRVLRVHQEMAQVLVCKGKVPERMSKTCC